MLDGGDRLLISQNAIYANGPGGHGLGIDLGGDGVTPNDAGDADTGPNGRQNFPVLRIALTNTGSTANQGTLDSTPNTSFRIEFFSSPKADPSGYGEGRTYLASTLSLTTNGAGRVSFTHTTEGAPVGHVVAAVAIPNDQVSGTLKTSEFSKAITVQDAPLVVTSVRPAPGAAGASAGANATAAFSEALEATTGNGTTFALTEKGTTKRVSATVRYDPVQKKADLKPKERLRAGVTYVATIKGGEGGVEDLAGKALATNKTWSFTVGG